RGMLRAAAGDMAFLGGRGMAWAAGGTVVPCGKPRGRNREVSVNQGGNTKDVTSSRPWRAGTAGGRGFCFIRAAAGAALRADAGPSPSPPGRTDTENNLRDGGGPMSAVEWSAQEQSTQRKAQGVRMTAARAFVECLKAEGVEVIFGHPGGAVLHLYDELYKAEFNHILARHEQGAAHMADGYARATGRVGVCIATSGPGATNLVTGLATAHMDSIPIVAITGNVNRALIGRDAFQEADITGITLPVTKHNFLVRDGRELPHIMRAAFHIARTGRPG